MNTNKNHILTAKQEKLISRLAMLSSSRKEAEEVNLSFFKTKRGDGIELSMLSFNNTSFVFVVNTEVDTFLYREVDDSFHFNASNFRASHSFNNLGLLTAQESGLEDLRLYRILDSKYFTHIGFDCTLGSGSSITQSVLDSTYLPKRLHSVFVDAKYSDVDSKSIAIATKVIGLEIFYISELRN